MQIKQKALWGFPGNIVAATCGRKNICRRWKTRTPFEPREPR